MKEFLLNHWWIANVIPYFGFNIWVVRTYERDEGRLDTFTKGCAYISALPVVITIILWSTLEMINSRIEKLDWQSVRGYRLFRRSNAAPIVVRIARGFAEALAILILYALFIATTGYHPNAWAFYFEVAMLWTIVELLIKLYNRRR